MDPVRLKRTVDSPECVSAQEIVTHARIEVGDENATVLPTLIAAARRHAEEYLQAAFLEQTWQWALDDFCDAELCKVPRPPLISVSSIVYIDIAGASITLPTTDYKVDTISQPGRIVPAYGKEWPSTRDEINAVVVTFKAGFGTQPSAVPADIRLAIMMAAAHYFWNREDHAKERLPDVAKRLLDLAWEGNAR